MFIPWWILILIIIAILGIIGVNTNLKREMRDLEEQLKELQEKKWGKLD